MSDIVRLADSERALAMDKVGLLKMQGLSDTQVSKELNIQRVVVKELFNEYKDTLAKDSEVRDRARDQLNLMVAHFDVLIKKLYNLLEELDGEVFGATIAAQKNAAIKQIAELEARRLEFMQKAGILDASDLGDELARMEDERDVVLDILRKDLCPQCRYKVMQKISQISKKGETVVVYD